MINLRISHKLSISFLIVVVVMGVIGFIDIRSLNKVDNSSNDIYNNNFQSTYMMTDMRNNLSQIRADVLKLLYERNDAEQNKALEKDIKSNDDLIVSM